MTRSLLLAGLGFTVSTTGLATARAQTLDDPRLRVSTWASGLSFPTTFTWIGPGEMLVIQLYDGQVVWIKDGVIQGIALDLAVQNDGGRGGLGIAADPDFSSNQHVYIFYSKTSASGDSGSHNNWIDNRVERFDWNGSALVNGFGPLVAIPMDPNQKNLYHDGGVIRFGTDGKLYGVTGDLGRGRLGGRQRIEQNTSKFKSSLTGGLFRIDKDGSIPADNPFVNEADTSLHH